MALIKQQLVIAAGMGLLFSAQLASAQGYPNQSPAARVYLANPVAISNAYTCQTGRHTDAVRCLSTPTGKQFAIGEVIPPGVGQPIGFAQLTPALRAQYHFDPARDYVLVDGYLYDLDHGTKIVRGIIPIQRQR